MKNPWIEIAQRLASALYDSPCGEWGSKNYSLDLYSQMKEVESSDLTFEGYFSDYPTEPIGGGNPYYRCVHCGISDPQINGDLHGHSKNCAYRLKREAELKNKFLFEILNQI